MNPIANIFISYRRGDSAHSARLWDHLVRWFGEENVFFDRERASIEPATEFPDVLEAGVQAAEIFLAVIGPSWLSESNLNRLKDEKNDYVRRELEQALNRRDAGENLIVLPLLVGGAAMPAPAELPPELARFSAIQAHRLSEGTEEYRADIEALVGLISTRCPGLRAERQNTWVRAGLTSPEQSRARFCQDIAVRAPGRQPIKRLAASSRLDEWWRTWAEHHQAFVLLGEEGDGKSWATGDWLADKLAGEDFSVPIVFAPALNMKGASVTGILAACLEQSQPTASEGWLARLRDLADQPQGAMPLFLLVVDSLNERTGLDWRELFDTIRASPWRERVASICLCRSPYWAQLGIPDDGLIAPWSLPPFNESELDQALAQRGSRRGKFEPDVLHWMARPRYFDLAFRLQGEIEKGGLTLERLIYEDWRDMTGRKRQSPCTPDEFQALIASLAEKYGDRSFRTPDFAQQANGIANDAANLRRELLSVHILDSQNGKLNIAPRYLPLGLGLVLAAEVEESREDDPAALSEVIARRMGAYRETDLQVRICGMALFHALNTMDYPEAGCLALLRAWVEGRNLDDQDLAKIAAYLPLRPRTYLHLAEYVWGEADNRQAQDAFMVGLLRHRELAGVQSELMPAVTRWLGFVYPWGYRAWYEKDAAKLAESRQKVEQKLGRAAVPGPVPLLGVELEVVNNAGLLRLAQVALAVISHDHAKGSANALLAGIVASTVMEGSHAEFPWVLHTCCPETRQALLMAARNLLAVEQPTAYLVARKLLASLGNEEARGLQESIPSEFRFVHPMAKMRKDNPCDSYLWSWNEDTYRDCLAQTSGDASFVARQLKRIALDPDIDFAAELRTRLDEAGNGLALSQIGRFMGTTPEQHTLDEMEPALCAFATGRYQELMRALARDLATRDGLARRQLTWHLLKHAPILSSEEREIVLTAWRSTLAVAGEHDRVAELALFPVVVLDLSAEEQMARLMERGDAGGYFTSHAPSFRPLSPGFGTNILAALKAVESGGTKPQHNLMWYLAEALRHTNKAVMEYLLARFDELDTAARGLCLQIFVNTGDAGAAQHVISGGWHVGDGRESYLENSWGSILLVEFGKVLPFDELARRISPEWLGYAVKIRGYQTDEVAAYAGLLDFTWHRIAARTPPPETASLGRYVVLDVKPGNERLAETISIEESGSNSVRIASYTWGGSAGAGSIKDLFRGDDYFDAQIKKHNALGEQVATLAENERRDGNPWFDHAFRDGGLAEVVALDDTLWRSWIEPVLRDDRRAWQLLALCRGFYEKLCAALLAHAPEQGLALFRALAARPTIRITDSRLDLPVLLMDAFAAPVSPQVEQLLRGHVDDGVTDMALFESTMLCQLGGRANWMRQVVGDWLQSDFDYDRARALALLGFSNAEADGATLATWIAAHADGWARDVAKAALENHRRNVWARCWFDRFLTRSDRTEAWAAFRLFLRCVDRRFWLWIDDTKLTDAEPWKRDAMTMNMGTIESACKENEKDWKDNFLGQKVLEKELWPWMAAYE